jgi:hypothetical protein
LRSLDPVAFVRFASVYRDFREARDFNTLVDELVGGAKDSDSIESPTIESPTVQSADEEKPKAGKTSESR